MWRFPPSLAAAGFLVAAACAAINLYGHPAVGMRALTILVGVVALALAVALLRMAFVVDADGLAVRFLLRATWIPWTEVKAIGLADVRGNETLRIVRHDDTQVDVPPSLLQTCSSDGEESSLGAAAGNRRSECARSGPASDRFS